MERSTVMKTLHAGNLIPKPPNMRDRDASFSSYLRPDEKPVVTCQSHDHNHDHVRVHLDDGIGSGLCRYVDDSSNELSIFDAHKYFNNEVNDIQKVPMSNNSRVSPVINIETESNIGPEKGGDTMENTTRYSSASSSVDAYAGIIRNYRGGSFHGSATPTASSEASWNSQSALLTHPNAGGAPASHAPFPEAVSQNRNDLNKKIKASLSKPIWILRRKCPCSGRKSVQVKENTTQHKSQVPQQQQQQQSLRHGNEIETKSMMVNPKNIHLPTIIPRNNSSKSQRFHQHRVVASSSVRVPFSDGFTFPVLNANPSSLKPKLLRADQNGVISGGEEDQPPRESLEVFQPPDDDCVDQTSENPRLVPGGGGGGDDDAASDASSDLFEIESLSTGAQPGCSVVFRHELCSSNGGNNGFFYGGGGGRRRSVDEGSTVTECYAPSEASVEWSVTTAEGCYEESLAGDGGDAAALAEKWRRKMASSSSSSSGNGLLAGCRSEKAVSVGPQPVTRKCVGEGGQKGSTTTSYSSWRHHHVNVNVNGNGNSCGNSRVVTALGKPPLARPHSSSTATSNTTPPMSLAFAAT